MVVTTDMLAAFAKVAETLSVSAAAVELGVGKGLVSKRIAQLETLVGATLFSRSSRRVALTPAGEAYLGGARRALAEVADAQERVRELRQQLSGTIRLTAPVSWGQRVRVAGRYHVNNPEAVAEAALAGIGVALLPGYLCTEGLRDGRLVRVLGEWTPVTRFGTTITALAAPERAALARNEVLLRFLQQPEEAE